MSEDFDNEPEAQEDALVVERAERRPSPQKLFASVLLDLLHATDVSVTATERGVRLRSLIAYYQDDLRRLRDGR